MFDNFPDQKALLKYANKNAIPEINAHIHTPYSFSAFADLEEAFRLARKEDISILGINDFNTTRGYDSFARLSKQYGIFPLFNIEFISLLKEAREKEQRINDPDNPGRIYFCGKGLRYPWVPPPGKESFLDNLVESGSKQVQLMVDKINEHFSKTLPVLHLSFEKIQKELAMELVRERHVAKAIRLMVEKIFPETNRQADAYSKLFGGKMPVARPGNPAQIENEIRSRLLKKGGAGYIAEDTATFLPVVEVRDFILRSGGIPCYPVLLDNPNGELTGFEHEKNKLAKALESMYVFAIELIPGRNDCSFLHEYSEFFFRKGFLVLYGTEHNTPELAPLRVSCREKVSLPENLKRISWQSACVVAAHQYLVARGKEGYCSENGYCRKRKRDSLIQLGNGVVHYFLNHYKPGTMGF